MSEAAMSLRRLYESLAELGPEQRALLARRLAQAEPGHAGLAAAAPGGAGSGPQAEEILPRPDRALPVPASLMQQRLWLLDRMEPGNPFYNLPLLCFELRGPLRLPALAACFTALAARHESLRTTFAEVDGEPVQVVAPAAPGDPSDPGDPGDPGERRLPLIDLAALPAAAGEAAAWRLAHVEARRTFDLARGPLWRTQVIRLAPRRHLLTIALHHIIADAWSIGVLYRELAILYAAGSASAVHDPNPGQGAARVLPRSLPPLPVQYPDFALWQRRQMAGERLAAEIAFWRGQLVEAPERVELPLDRPRPARRTYAGRRITLELPPGLPETLHEQARRAGASLYMVLLAAFDTLLHRLCSQDDLVVASPVASRTQLAIEGLIGFFVNTVVHRVRLGADLPAARLLARVRDVVLEVYEHQELPFDRLVEALRPRRDPGYGPVYQTMLSLQNTPTPDLVLGDLAVIPHGIDAGTCHTDLVLFAGMDRGRLGAMQLEFNTDVFDAATVQRFGAGLLALLAAAAAAPECPIGHLPLLGAAERHQLLREHQAAVAAGAGLEPTAGEPAPAEAGGAAGAAPAAADSLHRRFAARAATAPGGVAAVFEVEQLTYGDLDRQANRLGHRLRALGVGPEVRVGLCAERGFGLVVGILGILKAGGAYVPLDPTYPAERLRLMIEDAGVSVLLTRAGLLRHLPPEIQQLAPKPGCELSAGGPVEVSIGSPSRTLASLPGSPEGTGSPPGGPRGEGDALSPSLRSRLGSGTPSLALFEDAGPAGRPEAESLPPDDGGVGAANLAYVLFTSGSTGRPKGALVTHGNVLRLFSALPPGLAPGPRDVWSVFHSYAFDFSVWELWGALLHGGTAVLVPHWAARSPESLIEILAAERVTMLSQTPKVFHQLVAALEHDPGRPLAVRRVILGGEALDPGAAAPWFRLPLAAGGAGIAGSGGAQLINMYGITETTVHVTWHRVTAAEAVPAGPSLIGGPLGDLLLVVADRHLEALPLGVPGEILVGGAGLCRGYLGHPALTAERFVPDPFSGAPGTRLYRSGDRGRRLAGGGVEYLGRLDSQVKVRGMRIELGEVEAALARHPQVRQCAVAARELAPGDLGLAAYLVAADGPPPATAELRGFLAGTLPEFMIPGAFVTLAALPLSANGKLDRRALPAPERAGDTAGAFVAPRTPRELMVAELWRELLGVERLGVLDNFFELGGHSLLAARLAARLRDRLAREISVQLVFHHPTIAALAAALEPIVAQGEAAEAPALVATPRRVRRPAVVAAGS
jgi:amino acid adenylation domain-containing protein